MVAQYEGQTTDDDNTLANSDFEMRTKQNLHDKEESARVSKLGKLAGRIGVGSSGTGTVFSTIGLAKSEGPTKYKKWFGVTLGCWLVLLLLQSVLLWEASNKFFRHSKNLVRAYKIVYIVIGIVLFAFVAGVTTFWGQKGSFEEEGVAHGGEALLMVLSGFLYLGGSIPSIVVYFRYATQVAHLKSHTAEIIVNPAQKIVRRASNVGRRMSDAGRETSDRIKSRLSTRRGSNSAARSPTSVDVQGKGSPNDEDRLPEHAVYDYRQSSLKGRIVAERTSPTVPPPYFERSDSSIQSSDNFGQAPGRSPKQSSSSLNNPNSTTSQSRINPRRPVRDQFSDPEQSSSSNISSDDNDEAENTLLNSKTPSTRRPGSISIGRSSSPTPSYKQSEELFIDAPGTASQARDARSELPSQRPRPSQNPPNRYQAYSPPVSPTSSPRYSKPGSVPTATTSSDSPKKETPMHRAYSPPPVGPTSSSYPLNRNTSTSPYPPSSQRTTSPSSRIYTPPSTTVSQLPANLPSRSPISSSTAASKRYSSSTFVASRPPSVSSTASRLTWKPLNSSNSRPSASSSKSDDTDTDDTDTELTRNLSRKYSGSLGGSGSLRVANPDE